MKFNWQLKLSLSESKVHHLIYRDDELGTQMEIVTPKRKGKFGQQEKYWFIDGNDTEYTTQEGFLAALKERDGE